MTKSMSNYILETILGHLGCVDRERGQALWDAMVHADAGHIGSRSRIEAGGGFIVDLSHPTILCAVALILELSETYADFLHYRRFQ